MPSPNPRRFSLLSALLLLTTAAAAMGLYAARQENRELQAEFAPLRTENAKLRAEQGVLTIEDPQRIYAIRLPGSVRNVWKYRVYLPPGRAYYVAAQANRLPRGGGQLHPRFGSRRGPPNTTTIMSAVSAKGGAQVGIGEEAGEIMVTVRLDTNDKGEKAFTLSSGPPGQQGSSGFAIPSDPDEWPAIEKLDREPGEPSLSFSHGGVPEARQAEHTADALPLILLDYRVMHGSVRNSAESDEGLLVWVGRADENERDETPE